MAQENPEENVKKKKCLNFCLKKKKCSTRFLSIFFMLLLLASAAILAIYICVYQEIGPADTVQYSAYILSFIVNGTFCLLCLLSFIVVLAKTATTRAICGLDIGFAVILLLSLFEGILFNATPDPRSTRKFLRQHLRSHNGEPPKHFKYLQTHAACCGAKSMQDYVITKRHHIDDPYPLPKSCCGVIKNINIPCTSDSPFLHKKGCYSWDGSHNRAYYGTRNGKLFQWMEILTHMASLNLFLATFGMLLFNYFQCWKTSLIDPKRKKDVTAKGIIQSSPRDSLGDEKEKGDPVVGSTEEGFMKVPQNSQIIDPQLMVHLKMDSEKT